MFVYKTKIQGIPALVKIVSFYPGRTGNYCGHPDSRYPDEPVEIEYEICDRKGHYALWLERKLSKITRYALECELIDWLNKQNEVSYDSP